jgi:hypothetical protein
VPLLVAWLALTSCVGSPNSKVADRRTASAPVWTAPSPAPVRVTADFVHFRVQPRKIMLACGDGGFYLQGISYSTWSRDSATGRVLAVARFCPVTMRCGGAGETFHGAQSRIRLDRVRRVFGARLHTRLDHVPSHGAD